MKPTTIIVPASVSLSDIEVPYGQQDLEQQLAIVSGFLDAVEVDEPMISRLVRALTYPRLEPGPRAHWLRPYTEIGIADWCIDLIWAMRVRNVEHFFTVHELRDADLDNSWMGTQELGDYEFARIASKLEAPSLYTIPLCVRVPKQVSSPSRRESGEGFVRPYPAHADDARAVEGLARSLKKRMADLPGAHERLAIDPIRVPLAAMTASVWTAMKQPTLRRRSRFRSDALDLCIEALHLGVHRRTAERILRRDHPEHISIDVSMLPPNMISDRWQGRLGILQSSKSGSLEVAIQGGATSPKILSSLAMQEPF